MNMGGSMLTAEERAQTLLEFEASEMREREEETVCCVRIEAVNTGTVSRYS